MYQTMPAVLSPDTLFISDEAADVERFRDRHRRLCRDHQENSAPNSKHVESLDEDDGRTRKVSANWRDKLQTWRQHEDGYWPESAGTEMHLGFNAFDFSASPEAFNDEPEALEIKDLSAEIIDLQYDTFYDEELVLSLESEFPCYKIIPDRHYGTLNGEPELLTEANNSPAETKQQQTAKKELSMADVAKQVTSMGFNSASLWGRKLPGLRQLPSLNRDGVWGGPIHYATNKIQHRTFYYRYYA
ncbi:hypothetical protein ON010_g2894 [Phytophthora cinnamomi]|nr:hypothetical protein ON010_g2894 [Phytophthora cinnamomi]